jgi:hypothetical protein
MGDITEGKLVAEDVDEFMVEGEGEDKDELVAEDEGDEGVLVAEYFYFEK